VQWPALFAAELCAVPSAPVCTHLGLAKLLIATPSPSSIYRTITLRFKQIRVTNVMTAQERGTQENHDDDFHY